MANIKGTNAPETLQGTALGDHIDGKGGDDIILGLAGNDKIDGGDGNDTITGAGGDDAINGGKGIDVAIYNGDFVDYSILYTGHRDGHGADDLHITVTDHGPANEGTDQVQDVEFLHFNNAVFDVGLDVTHFARGNVDASALYNDGVHTPEPYWGHGNSSANYNIADLNDQNIELGLKVHYRGGADILPTSVDNDGTVHYNAPSGTDGPGTHSLWNFDYVVNTGLHGSTATLGDYDFKAVFTELAGDHQGTSASFTLDPATHTWTNDANPASFFGGDDFGGHPASATVMSQVSENSQNLGFGFFTGVFGPLANATAAGTTYDIQLEAFDHSAHGNHGNVLIGSAHDVVTLV